MNPRVIKVQPQADYMLRLWFTSGEVKVFDMKPYLDIGIFRQLRDQREFHAVQPLLGSIQWRCGADLCPDMLYELSVF
jgi:hypothetical protein